MKAELLTCALEGVRGRLVPVTVEVLRGSAGFSVVGSPATTIAEARVRAKAAVENSGFKWPTGHVQVTSRWPLGISADLAVALGVLAATDQIPNDLSRTCVVGELALDGRVRGFRGALPMGIAAASSGDDCLRTLCAGESAQELQAGAPGEAVLPFWSLAEAVGWCRGEVGTPRVPPPNPGSCRDDEPDLADVRSQVIARRALEVAAAGGHGLILRGCPGAGRTLLARRLPGILPPMTPEERLEASCIASVAGLLRPEEPLLRRRPFRAPHHTVSEIALVGGGAHNRPGEVSLAHGGVLFLDELPEFRRQALDALFRVLEEGRAAVTRGPDPQYAPARPLVVASMNPCPCGYLGHPRQRCVCSPAAVAAYQRRVEPFLRHFDMVVDVPPVSVAELRDAALGETSAVVQARIIVAREWRRNMGPAYAAGLSPTTRRVAQTLADLEQSPLAPKHVDEATSLARKDTP